MPRLSPFEMALYAYSFRRALREQLCEHGLMPLNEDDARPFLIDVRVPYTAQQIVRPTPTPLSEGRDLALALERALLGAQVKSRIGPIHYRGVPDERLDRVLETGIDVVPASAPFFADPSPSKALEYGGHPKLIIVLDSRALDKTYRELPAKAPARRLSALMRTFPTRYDLEGGSMIRLSRFHRDPPDGPFEGEAHFGRWIPRNARRALVAVLRVEAAGESGRRRGQSASRRRVRRV